MLGLIAFALMILACSYWRLSGQLDQDREGQRDVERGAEEEEGGSGKSVKVYEEKILVIMAGDENPTFLATPVCAKISSSSSFSEGKGKDEGKQGDNDELDVKENSDEKVMNKETVGNDDHQAAENGANSETQESH